MKRILCLILVALIAFPAPAAVITGRLVDPTGTAIAGARVTFSPTTTPQIEGGSIITSRAVVVTTSGNGTFSATLEQGNYRAAFAGTDPILISVPNTTNSYSIESITTNALTYIYTVPPANLATLPSGVLAGRHSSGLGAIEPVTVGEGLSLASGVLAVTNAATSKMDVTNGVAWSPQFNGETYVADLTTPSIRVTAGLRIDFDTVQALTDSVVDKRYVEGRMPFFANTISNLLATPIVVPLCRFAAVLADEDGGPDKGWWFYDPASSAATNSTIRQAFATSSGRWTRFSGFAP